MFFQRKKKIIVGIEGMHCDKCALKVDRALEDLSDVDRVKVNLKKKTATVFFDHSVDEVLIQKTIEDLGYTVTGIKGFHS